MADIKVLMVVDGDRFNYGPTPTTANTENFSIAALLDALESSTTPSIQLVKAHRRGSNTAAGSEGIDLSVNLDIPGNFTFTDARLADIDVVWLYCDEGLNGGLDSGGSEI